MRNKIEITTSDGTARIDALAPGQMFRCQLPTREDSVYMRTRQSTLPTHLAEAILLATGELYQFSNDKFVVPLRAGQQVIITQGG